MTSTSSALKKIYKAARPLIADGLDIAEQIAALRDTATDAGLDWSQIKALLKAQIQDERDENGDGKRVKRLLEKADHATAYADLLGLSNMNEEKYFAEVVTAPPHDPDTGEILDTESRPEQVAPQPETDGAAGEEGAVNQTSPAASIPETPPVDPPVTTGAAGEAAEGVNPQSAPSADTDDEALALPSFLDRRATHEGRAAA